MNIYITGINGFIGHHVAMRLIREGHTVIGIDNMGHATSHDIKVTRAGILDAAMAGTDSKWYQADIRDPHAIDSMFRGCDIHMVFHFAALPGVAPSVNLASEYLDVNLNGTLVLLDNMRRHGVKTIVYASSSTVYGRTTPGMFGFNLTLPTNSPLCPYAVSKKAAELLLYNAFINDGVSVRVLRYFSVYGPLGRPDMFVDKCVGECIRGGSMTIKKSIRRAFTYIDDVVDITTADKTRINGFRVSDVGGDTLSLREAYDIIADRFGKCAEVIEDNRPLPPYEMPVTIVDRSYGKHPEMTSFRDGIELLSKSYVVR